MSYFDDDSYKQYDDDYHEQYEEYYREYEEEQILYVDGFLARDEDDYFYILVYRE